MKRLGVDVGGTFTDIILIDDESGEVFYHKLPSTPDDPSEGMLQGLRELCDLTGVSPGGVDHLFHGTTVAINTVIEHSGAKVGLITTEGFRDILAIGRHKRPVNYSLQFDIPHQKHPLVQRRHRLGVRERIIPPDGEVLTPLDEDQVRAAIEHFQREGIEAVAVALLWSFLNPDHEQRVEALVRELMPGAYVSTSHAVVSQFREFERFSTTALNAYVGPRVSRYVQRTTEQLEQAGFDVELHLMQSSGGMSTAGAAIEKPVTLALSGPVAGLLAGVWLAAEEGYQNVITLDMGGTSADIGVARAGEVRFRQLMESKAADYQVMLPMIDIDSIGAGGGSIAYVDATGMFRVGPRSAGAEPGPACYGLGGREPTGTDANLVLGRLDANQFLGGRMALYPEPAHEAMEEKLGSLGLPRDELALGIIEVLNSSMVSGIELNSVRRGYDPREFALVAFGGAGPLHAGELARELDIGTVIVPPAPGITSAFGLLATDVRYEYGLSDLQDLASPDPARLNEEFRQLERDAVVRLEADGFEASQIRISRIADCRYQGQAYELRVPLPGGELTMEDVQERLVESFHDVHGSTYGVRLAGKPVQLVNVRVVGVGQIPRFSLPQVEEGSEDAGGAVRSSEELPYRTNGVVERVETPRYDRARLLAGNVIGGPALVDQTDSTTLVLPGSQARVSQFGSLIVTAGETASGR